MDPELQELIKQKTLDSLPGLGPFKKKYEEYKELYEKGKQLVDPDTRSTVIFREAMMFFLKKAGEFLGEDLTKHPYFVLNKPGMDALFQAITAIDTINNARKLLSDAEAKLVTLDEAARKFTKSFGDSYTIQTRLITMQLTTANVRGRDWVQYVRQLGFDRFEGMTREEAKDEIREAIGWAGDMLDDLASQLSLTVQVGANAFKSYYALTGTAAQLVAAEKAYTEKIAKLSGSSETVTSTMGKAEEKRRWEERGMDAIKSPSGGKTIAQRVQTIMDSPSHNMDLWQQLCRWSTGFDILRVGSWSGQYMPWELELPPK